MGAHFEYEHHDHPSNVTAKLASEEERGIDELSQNFFHRLNLDI